MSILHKKEVDAKELEHLVDYILWRYDQLQEPGFDATAFCNEVQTTVANKSASQICRAVKRFGITPNETYTFLTGKDPKEYNASIESYLRELVDSDSGDDTNSKIAYCDDDYVTYFLKGKTDEEVAKIVRQMHEQGSWIASSFVLKAEVIFKIPVVTLVKEELLDGETYA